MVHTTAFPIFLASVSVDPYNKRFWSIGPAIATWTISANIDNLDKISNLIQGIDIFLSKAESFVNLESAAAKYVVPELNDKDQGEMFFTMMSKCYRFPIILSFTIHQ